MKLYLASKSPRRHELLQQIDIAFEIIDVDIDESWDGRENAKRYVERLALEKAGAGFATLNDNTDAAVLAADTAVVLDDQILGKAGNQQEAVTMLEQLSGRTHLIYSGVALKTVNNESVTTSISRVSFKPLAAREIQSYCETREPLGKAGAYAIQGRAAVFVARLEGSYSGVMGLPLYETCTLLQHAGIS